jgi:hypothetical protein
VLAGGARVGLGFGQLDSRQASAILDSNLPTTAVWSVYSIPAKTF